MIYHVQVVEAAKKERFEADLAAKIDSIQSEGMRAEVLPMHVTSTYFTVLLLAHQDS